MKLSSFLQYGNKKTNAERTEEAIIRAAAQEKGDGRRVQEIKTLFPGQTLNGEVISMEGKEIQIKTDQAVILNARLEKELSLVIGQSLTFEVKSSANGQVALRPLFENMAQDVNLLKALEAARLPASDAMVNMVSLMMRQGMSIDKLALQEMSRLVNANPSAAPELVVMLKGMGVAVTPENLDQLRQYLNLEHSVLNEMTQIADSIPEALHQMVSRGELQEAAAFLRQLTSFFFRGEQGVLTAPSEGSVFSEEPGFRQLQQGAVLPEGELLSGLEAEAETKEGQTTQAGLPEVTAETEKSGEQPDSRAASIADGAVLSAENSISKELQPGLNEAAGTIGDYLSKSDCQNLSLLLGRLGADNQLLAGIAAGTVTGSEVLRALEKLLSEQKGSGQTADLSRILTGKEFQQLFRNELLQQWLLKPEEVTGGRQIADFYRRLSEQTQKLSQAAEQSSRNTPLSRNLNALQNNVQFMNQMNQVYQFIQLPLKMMESNTNGELYVYRRKGQKMTEDGSVTALLHLDMEHLGSMDVHIEMKDQNVATKFYLEDERIMDFLGHHMDSLDSALSRKGYQLKSELIHKQETEEANVISRLTGADTKGGVLAQYSFDVRA